MKQTSGEPLGSRKKTSRERLVAERKAKIKRLVDSGEELTVRDIAERLGVDVKAVYRDLYALGVDVKRLQSGMARYGQALADATDLEFALYAFGKCDYDNPPGEQDEEYKREVEFLGRPGFFYVGELWRTYRDFWEHKRRGMTLQGGKWRKSTANDGRHASEYAEVGAIYDKKIQGVANKSRLRDPNWDDWEDWY